MIDQADKTEHADKAVQLLLRRELLAVLESDKATAAERLDACQQLTDLLGLAAPRRTETTIIHPDKEPEL